MIEQKIAECHATLANSASKVSKLGSTKPSYGAVSALAGLVAIVVVLGSIGYLLIHLAPHKTTMITHRGVGSVDSAFKTSAFIWAGLSLAMMFKPKVAFGKKLTLALWLSLGGFPSLAVAIDDHNERVAETRIFSKGGVESTKNYPIVGTRIDHGWSGGVSYRAMIDPHNHGHRQDLRISAADFNMIGTVAPHDIYSPKAPDAKFCVTLKLQTSGDNERILWSSFDMLPLGWIAPCTAAQTARFQQAYHEEHWFISHRQNAKDSSRKLPTTTTGSSSTEPNTPMRHNFTPDLSAARSGVSHRLMWGRYMVATAPRRQSFALRATALMTGSIAALKSFMQRPAA